MNTKSGSKSHLPREVASARIFNIETYNLQQSLDAFVRAKSAENCTKKTLAFYRERLSLFIRYLAGEGIERLADVDRGVCNAFFDYLEQGTSYNPGGRHAIFRATKTLLGWMEASTSGDYASPMWHFPGPRLQIEPIKGVEMKVVDLMAAVADGVNKKRDVALLYFLADTGVRAQELCDLNVEDIDFVTGLVTIRKGKWRKRRTVVMGFKVKKLLRAYLKTRFDAHGNAPLFETDEGVKMAYTCLRGVVRRLSERAGVEEPGLHGFRRLFAVTMHRNGVDDITIARFMGHSTTEVLKRYLAEDEMDLAQAHRRGSPVDHT
jgi:integrase/recombinase XerD